MPIREALKLLPGEGIGELRPERRLFISPLSMDEALQLYWIRHQQLEAELLRAIDRPSVPQPAAEALPARARRVRQERRPPTPRRASPGGA